MLVRELKRDYPQIYILAKRNIENQHPEVPVEFYEGHNLSGSMVWARTPEGGNFWNAMNTRRVDSAQKMFPEFFEAPPEFINGVKVTKNGLLK